jgi:hypothetical protein
MLHALGNQPTPLAMQTLGVFLLDTRNAHHTAGLRLTRANDGSAHEPCARHRSDPSSAAVPVGSPASWPDREHGCECRELRARDATRTRHTPPRNTTSPRLVASAAGPLACKLAQSTRAAPSRRLLSPDAGWSCRFRASEIPRPNLTCSIRLQRNSGPAHYPFWRTGCSPCGLPLVSPMRLVVVRNRTGTTSPAAPA